MWVIRQSATKLISVIFMVLFVVSCTSNSVRVDYNSAIDISELRLFNIISINENDQISADRLIMQTSNIIERNALVTSGPEAADATIELDHFIEERPNDSRFSIGLGTGSYGRSSSIGVGGSVDLPLGEDMISYAVVIVNIVVENRVAWTATHSIEIEAGKATGINDAQLKALEEIFEEYPHTLK